MPRATCDVLTCDVLLVTCDVLTCLDEKTKTGSVKSVKRLSAVASTCALPPKAIKK